MKYSDIKKLAKKLNSWRDIVEQIDSGEEDFTVDGYRFISTDSINEILKEEISSDTYMLGCFVPSFMSGIIGLSQSVIEEAQSANSCDLLGQLMLNNIDAVVEQYVRLDGYGGHFGVYDGNENSVDGEEYLYFRID
jgi:hypothetical protein